MLYQEKPNIVKIVMSDASGTAERYSVGRTLDEVISVVEDVGEVDKPAQVKKPRAKRRTKAEIEAAKQDDPPAPEGTISSEPVEKKHRRIFP